MSLLIETLYDFTSIIRTLEWIKKKIWQGRKEHTWHFPCICMMTRLLDDSLPRWLVSSMTRFLSSEGVRHVPRLRSASRLVLRCPGARDQRDRSVVAQLKLIVGTRWADRTYDLCHLLFDFLYIAITNRNTGGSLCSATGDENYILGMN